MIEYFYKLKNMSNFYIVGTPIGNMEDMTFRAVRILGEVDLILCEDVSNAHKLLKHYDINTKCTNYFANSRLSKIDEVIAMLEEGKDIALISDAGMPAISDPGSLLIKKIYEAKSDGLLVDIRVVPTATALTSALSISGLTGGEFVFYGFLPHKKGRETIFKEIEKSDKISAFYESVHRIEKCLESLGKILDEGRTVVIGRELTKIHEEIVRGNITQVREYFKENKDKLRGEFVVIVDSK